MSRQTTGPSVPSTPRHHRRPDSLLDELVDRPERVSDRTRRMAAAVTGGALPAAEPPACPTTGRLGRFKGQYATSEDALRDARTVIQTLAGVLRPFSLIREMRVIDADSEPRTVCDVVIPMRLASQIDQALDLVQSFVLADQHLRVRQASDATQTAGRPAAA